MCAVLYYVIKKHNHGAKRKHKTKYDDSTKIIINSPTKCLNIIIVRNINFGRLLVIY